MPYLTPTHKSRPGDSDSRRLHLYICIAIVKVIVILNKSQNCQPALLTDRKYLRLTFYCISWHLCVCLSVCLCCHCALLSSASVYAKAPVVQSSLFHCNNPASRGGRQHLSMGHTSFLPFPVYLVSTNVCLLRIIRTHPSFPIPVPLSLVSLSQTDIISVHVRDKGSPGYLNVKRFRYVAL